MLASVAGVPKSYGSTIDQRDPINTAVQQVLSQGNSTVNNLTATGTITATGDVTTSGNTTANGNVTATTGLISGPTVEATGTTDATSTATGSLQSAGGLGVAKSIFAGDKITAGAQTSAATGEGALINGCLCLLQGTNTGRLFFNALDSTLDPVTYPYVGFQMGKSGSTANAMAWTWHQVDNDGTLASGNYMDFTIWGQGASLLKMFTDGHVEIPCSLTASSTTTGALRVSGDIGVNGGIWVNPLTGVVMGDDNDVYLRGGMTTANPQWNITLGAGGGTPFTNSMTNTGWSTPSDVTMKTMIEPLTNGLDLISKLKPVRYDWKDADGKALPGLIAQDVKEVVPEAVVEHKDGKLGITYNLLVPILIKAIQELNKRLSFVEGCQLGSMVSTGSYIPPAKKRKTKA